MLPLILILLLLALVFGGFFVFSLKVAVVVAIVLLLVGAFGGYGYRGRRTVYPPDPRAAGAQGPRPSARRGLPAGLAGSLQRADR